MKTKRLVAIALLGLATYAAAPKSDVSARDLRAARAGSICVKVAGRVFKYSSHNIPYGVIYHNGAAIEFVNGGFYPRNRATFIRTPRNHHC